MVFNPPMSYSNHIGLLSQWRALSLGIGWRNLFCRLQFLISVANASDARGVACAFNGFLAIFDIEPLGKRWGRISTQKPSSKIFVSGGCGVSALTLMNHLFLTLPLLSPTLINKQDFWKLVRYVLVLSHKTRKHVFKTRRNSCCGLLFGVFGDGGRYPRVQRTLGAGHG